MALEPVWARFRVSLVSKLQKSERKKKWPLRFDSHHVDFFAITHNNPASKGTEEERDGMHFQIIAAGGEKEPCVRAITGKRKRLHHISMT